MATIRSAIIYKVVTLVPPPPPPPPPPEQDPRIVDVPLNIGGSVLDIWDDNSCYLLVCTVSGVECLKSRTFESVWYFGSEEVKSVCYNGEKVCFGTVSSGVYYNNFPSGTGYLENFLSSCNVVSETTSNNIVDIYATASGFFVGGESGIDILVSNGSSLEVTCQLICSGINSVAYSVDTGMYYWSTANTAYCADTCT